MLSCGLSYRMVLYEKVLVNDKGDIELKLTNFNIVIFSCIK